MSEAHVPAHEHARSRKRRELTPEVQAAFDAFGQAVFADGALLGRR